MRALITLLIIIGSAVLSKAAEVHSRHFLDGMPRDGQSGDLIIRDIYVLRMNEDTRFASWVAYKLTPHEVLGELDLERKWRLDEWLDEKERLEPGVGEFQDDYAGAYADAGYDRGHLAPLASFVGSRYASQVNYYSNIVPQQYSLNRGPWRSVESSIRQLVVSGQSVYVITGVYYNHGKDSPPPLPEADEIHRVPDGFWKVAAARTNQGVVRVAAFMMPQHADEDPKEYLVSVDEIEIITGINLFPQLSDSMARKREATVGLGWVEGWP